MGALEDAAAAEGEERVANEGGARRGEVVGHVTQRVPPYVEHPRLLRADREHACRTMKLLDNQAILAAPPAGGCEQAGLNITTLASAPSSEISTELKANRAHRGHDVQRDL